MVARIPTMSDYQIYKKEHEVVHFNGIHYKDRFENQDNIMEVTEQKDGCILILVRVEGDHPMLIVVNPEKKEFHVEGYD